MSIAYFPMQSARTIYASRCGCVLNADPSTYTGTDDHAAAQAALNFLGSSGGGTFIFDGLAALGSVLTVHGNTRVLANGSGDGVLMLPDSGGVAFRNANWISSYDSGNPTVPYVDPTRLIDENIEVNGLTIYGGAYAGAGGNPDWGCLDAAGQFASPFRFFGVNGAKVKNCKIYDPCAFGVWFHNAFNNWEITDNLIIDTVVLALFNAGSSVAITALTYAELGFPDLQYPNAQRGVCDSVHINGPAFDGVIARNVCTSTDDMFGLNADDSMLSNGGTYPALTGPTAFGGTGGFSTVFVGPIDRVTISEMTGICCLTNGRVFTGFGQGSYTSYGNSRIDNVIIEKSYGNCYYQGIGITPLTFLTGGNIGKITLRDLFFTYGTAGNTSGGEYLSLGCNAEQIIIENSTRILPQPATQQTIQIPEGTYGDVIIRGMTIYETTGTITAPMMIVNGATIERLIFEGVTWARDSNVTTAPMVLITGNSAVTSIGFSHVRTNRVRNFVQFDSSYSGISTVIVFVDGSQHLGVADTDGIVRNDSSVAISAHCTVGTSGSNYTVGVATQNTGAGSITAV